MTNKISTQNSNVDWKQIRLSLRDKQKLQPEWGKTIQLFNERVLGRYFDPITYLIDKEGKSTGEGFSILTIQCSLIEFLATTVEGMVFRYEANSKKSYYYSKSEKWYIKFLILNSANIFEDYFHGTNHSRAHDFYKNVRCALIHEAQTKNNWTIGIFEGDKKRDKLNRKIFDDKKIYRTALNNALKDFFINFCNLAKEENKTGMRYRKFIARRLDVICELEPDDCFWW